MSTLLLEEPSAKKTDYKKHAFLWESSGLKQKEYCQKHSLNYQSFTTARTRLLLKKGKSRIQKKQSKFVPVFKKDSCSTPKLAPDNIIICLPKGSKIELPANISSDQLISVLKVLREKL